MFLGESITLIVAYKDELLVNQLKKLVDEKNKKNEEGPQIKIVAWTEKVWKDQKKTGTIANKVLFLGSIEGVKDLTPIIDVKFDKHGVKYGWAGSQAVLLADH